MSVFGSTFGSVFGAIFGSAGGAVVPLAPVEVSDAATCVAARARLPIQFRGKPKLEAWLCTLATPAQEIEDTLVDLLGRSIDTSVGYILDTIGKIVGQARNGLSDDDYRPYLRARIATNRSGGTTENLIRIARLVVNVFDTTMQVVIQNWGAGALIALIDKLVLTDALRVAALAFLQQGASDGVRVIFQNVTVTPSQTFTTALSAVTTGVTAGTGVIDVDSTAGFPASGTIKIDAGNVSAGNEESLAYVSKTASRFVLAGTAGHNHASGADVQLVGTGAAGRGFGVDCVTSGYTAGSGTLVVDDTTGFPASGTVQIDGGNVAAGNEELLNYTSKTGTTFTLSAPGSHNHAAGALVVDAGNDAAAAGAYIYEAALYGTN